MGADGTGWQQIIMGAVLHKGACVQLLHEACRAEEQRPPPQAAMPSGCPHPSLNKQGGMWAKMQSGLQGAAEHQARGMHRERRFHAQRCFQGAPAAAQALRRHAP